MNRRPLIPDYPALPDPHPDRRPLWKEVGGSVFLAVLVIAVLVLVGGLEGVQ